MDKGKLLLLLGLMYFVSMSKSALAQSAANGKMRYRITAVQAGNEDVWSMSNVAEVVPPMTVFVPSAFSPNGDGLNDEFKVKGRGIKSCKIQVWDRWGQLVYESDKIDEGWNGTYKNKDNEVMSDAFVYQVSAYGHAGGAKFVSGTVTIVK